MPITILEPLTGGPLGPFIRVQASTSLIGPLPLTYQWRLKILEEPPGETTIYEYTVATNGLRTLDTLLQPNTSSSITQPIVDKRTVQGQPVVFKVILEDDGSVIEEAQVSPTWDWLTGTAWSQIGVKQAVEAGAFAEQDRVVLMQAQGGILSLLVDVFLEPVVEWLAQYLPQSWQPIPYSPLVCDETILTRPTLAPFVRWVGVRWQLVQWPSGLGIVDGFPDHSYAAWGQISLTKLNDDGQAIVYDTRYESRTQGELLWGSNEPYNVQVYVLPGVCAEFSALSAPPWSPARSSLDGSNPGISSSKAS